MDQTLGAGSSAEDGRFRTGTTLPSSKRRVAALWLPGLWFYRCNNCDAIGPVRRLRLEYHPRAGLVTGLAGQTLAMMLCTKCLHEYNRWTKRWGSDSNIQRSRDTGESGETYDVEMTNR